jgi:hypothetical protein
MEKSTVTKKKLLPLRYLANINMGCDPEFFFTKKGQVIGSEKVLSAGKSKADSFNGKFVIDGVQAELNPQPSTCRAAVTNAIRLCFKDLHDKVLAEHKGVSADFSQCIEVSKEEMDSLSEKSKIFGCAPSTNVYNEGKSKTSVIGVDPKKYRGRSAGGHVHLGIHSWYSYDDAEQTRVKNNLKNVEVLVPILDIVVGNTCVLLDRAESNKERRKVYGRAGEYRLKDYGIEYRTLSNFWLRSCQLTSFVFSLSRLAVHLVRESKPDNDYVKALFDAVKREDVVKAINNNDFDLAMENFKAIEEILLEACEGNYGNFPFSRGHINHFYYAVDKGLDHWFDKDPLKHWMSLPETHGWGWERWLEVVVGPEYKKLGIEIGNPKYKDFAPEADKQDYINGYGSGYKPMMPEGVKLERKKKA